MNIEVTSISPTEVPLALELEVYDVNGADVYEPGSEYYQFSCTDSENWIHGNIDLKKCN